jgi:hypothetical protein
VHSDTDTDAEGGSDAPDSDVETAEVDAGTPGLGRRIMLALGATIVAISGGVGLLVGGNGAEAASEAAVLGTAVTIPLTPGAVALYGIVVSTLVLAVLFGLVELASRAEADAGDPDAHR